jgi:hypothetical protein
MKAEEEEEEEGGKRTYLIYITLQPFIISETGAAIWLQINFGPTGHCHPQSSPLPRICTVLSIFYQFLSESWEDMFCKAV